jgi:hypothetical protein
VNGHDFHAGQPDYSAAQILHDGCGACSYRSSHPDMAIARLDVDAFAAAWKRAADWQHGSLSDVSEAEVPVLRALWSVEVQMERLGFPVGTVPLNPAGALLAAAGLVASGAAA